MNLTQWLSAKPGRMTEMAAHFGLNKTAIFGWKVNGVPKDRMKAIREFTGGAVTLEEMVPDAPSVEAKAA